MKNIRLISVMLVVFILISSLISCDILDASETQKESSQNVTEAKIETEESESMSSVKGTGVFVGDENASGTVETEEDSSELIITDETVSETVYETISETETVVEEYEGTKVEMFWKEKDRSTIIDDPMNE